MNNHKYIVYFSNDRSHTVYTGSKMQAEILACAEEIKKGNDYVVTKIVQLED